MIARRWQDESSIGILKHMSKAGGCGAVGFLLMFGLFWTGITGAFDVFIGYNIWRQMQAESWPTVAGEVTRSEVESSSDSDGTTYSAEISFRYEVSGQPYEADTWRFGAWGSSDSSEARDVVKRYPVGQSVEVRYNPDDPASAVLEAGVQGMDLFLLLFMTPFNMVMLGFWYVGLAKLLPRRATPAVGRARVVESIDRVRVIIPSLPPIAVAGIVAGVMSFIMIFIVGFGFGFNPPAWVITGTWAVVLGLAIVAGMIQFYRKRAGLTDLVLDSRHQMASLPTSSLFANGPLVAFERFTRTRIDRITHRHKNSTSTSYKLWLHYRDDAAAEQAVSICDWPERAESQQLADWLNDRLSITTRDDSPVASSSIDAPNPVMSWEEDDRYA